MFLKEYLSINESLDYLDKKIKENNDIQRSAKTILTNAIDLHGLRPSFKYKGYGILYRTIREKESRNSIEFKQVFRISGYFYDSSTFDPDDFETFSQFSNLDEPFFYASMAVVDKLANHDYLTTHYLANINDDDIHRSKIGKDSEIEELNFQPHQYLRLTDDYPIFDDFIQTNTESVKIPRSNIFFKIDDLNYVIGLFSESKDSLDNSLISYLNFEQTIQFISQSTNNYFQESNLVDLIANNNIIPMVFFEGYATSKRYAEDSKYPDDFQSEADSFKVLKHQENRVIGYFYLMDAIGLIANLYDYNNRFKVYKILNQQAIPDRSLPNSGINDAGGIMYETPISENDTVSLFSYSNGFGHEEPPKFTKDDLRFSLYDIAKCSISLSSLSGNELTNSLDTDTARNNDLNSKLTDEIKDLNFKLDKSNSEINKLRAKLKEQTDTPAFTAIDEGQGDTLLILGAVMDCIKEVAKPNYTQGLLITAITDKYKNTSSLTYSTLSKKFPKAKTHLKQNVTP